MGAINEAVLEQENDELIKENESLFARITELEAALSAQGSIEQDLCREINRLRQIERAARRYLTDEDIAAAAALSTPEETK